MVMIMNDDLIKQVQEAMTQQPTWLQQKRQLAGRLAGQFDPIQGEDSLIKAWASQPDLFEDNDEIFTKPAQAYVDLPLFQAAQAYPELLQENLMEKAIFWQASRLNAWHLALLNGGRFIYVPDGVKVDQPIEIKQDLAHPNYHNLIIIGANAQATIVENQVNTGNTPAYFGTEILLGDTALLNYYQANRFTARQNWEVVRAYQAGDSQLNTYIASFDRHDLYAETFSSLDGDGSAANFKAVAVASGQQHYIARTRIDNHGLHTDGLIQQNGVVRDQAVLDFHAVGKIFKGAHVSTSNQESRLLTLNEEAKGETDPVLLIEDNDVNAGHAASIGQVSEDQLYYLQSRGLSLRDAQILLTKGFLLPVIEKFPDPALRKQVVNQLLERLGVEA